MFVNIRVVEQSQQEFHPQDIANSLVYEFFGDHSLFHQFFQVSAVGKRHHIHVYTCFECKLCRVGGIFGKTVRYHLIN